MGGSVAGGIKTAQKIKELYGEDYYVIQGRKGGQASTGGGFGQGEEGRERARAAGAKGGKLSVRKADAERRDTFIEAWNLSQSATEAARLMGISRQHAASWASRLRREGFELQRFRKENKV